MTYFVSDFPIDVVLQHCVIRSKDNIQVTGWKNANEGVKVGGRTGAVDKVLKRFAWLPPNLFIGPNANFRSDDPSQRIDKIPCSISGNRREFITSLIDFSTSFTRSNIATSQNDIKSIQLKNPWLKANIPILESRLMNAGKVPYETQIGDWHICEGRKKYRISFCLSSTDKTQRDLIHKKLSVTDCTARLENDRAFIIYAYEDKGHNSYFYGNLERLKPEDRRMQTKRISNMIERLPNKNDLPAY